jgi:LuxR family maltose regulon positive regulatory protein
MGLLTTKLHPPPARRKLAARMGLLDRLNDSLSHKMTILCAPAGYGKTTLLSHWIDRRSEPVAWLAVDRSDNDLAQFLFYLLATVQQIDPEVGTIIPDMLQPPRPSPNRAVLTALVNDLAASEEEFLLILDDYHEIENHKVHEALGFLLDHMPANVHLILATRVDPPIQLAKLRAEGQLRELRAADLRFEEEDAAQFFRCAMDLDLSDGEVNALVEKAEGWVAGLQIAGLLLQNQPDPSQVVQSFTGSHRHIVDYLAAEVIDRLSLPIQEFLCRAAILEDLTPSLCDAVTGRTDSRQILEQLVRENLFIIPIEDKQQLYRFHRLMAEALRIRTEELGHDLLAAFHDRASVWYQQHGRIEAAIDHAFKSDNVSRAADLIEANVQAMLKRSRVITLRNWLDMLPEESIHHRCRLAIAYAWASLLGGGSLQVTRIHLQRAAACEPDDTAAAEVAVIEGLIAMLSGDWRRALDTSGEALASLPEESVFLRSVASDNLGMAYVFQGDMDSAIRNFSLSSGLSQESGNIMFAVASISNLGGLYLQKGRLKEAHAIYLRGLDLGTAKRNQRLPVACRALLGLGEIAREWNELERSRQWLEDGLRLSQQYSETSELMLYLNLARVVQAQGEVEQALDLIYQAQTIAVRSAEFDIDDRLVDVALARFHMQQGNIAAATEWAAARGYDRESAGSIVNAPAASSIPHDLYEGELLQYARLQLLENRPKAALEILDDLLAVAKAKTLNRRLVEIQVLRALAFRALALTDQALDALQKSLKIAEPEGYVRVYLDEGPRIVGLLRRLARRGAKKQYCRRLLQALQEEASGPAGASQQHEQILVEPLSEREIQVLQLLAEGCTNQQICERLYLSMSTVKGHNSNIYGKLLVKNRTEAVARARQLGVLPSG